MTYRPLPDPSTLSDPERVLVLAPFGRDAVLLRQVLAESGLSATICPEFDHLCTELLAGAGVVVIADEALTASNVQRLGIELERQPAWSDMPVLVLTSGGESNETIRLRFKLLEPLGNVTLLERPLRKETVTSSVRAALRSRRHQYQIKNHLDEQERSAEALRNSEERLRIALDTAELGTWELDVSSGRVHCSPRYKRNYGLHPDGETDYAELVSMIHPEDRERMLAAMQQAISERGEYEAEYRVIWPDGSTHWLVARGRAHQDNNGTQRLMGVAMDVTDRVRAESTLRQSESRYRTLAETLPQLVWTCLPDGSCDYLSTQWVDYTGIPEDQQLGWRWIEVLHPDDRERTHKAWMAAVAGEAPYDVEFRLRGQDREYRWFKTRGTAVRDESGRIVKWFGTCTDITDRLEIEETLRTANRELEEFAYVSSHDLQEPLRMVTLYTQQLLRKHLVDETSQAREYAEFIRQGVTRMEHLIKDLLSYSRTIHGDGKGVGSADLNASLAQARAMVKNRIQETGAIVTYDDLPVVRGDEAQIAHVFQNLLSNALKYRKDHESTEIQVWARQEGDEWIVAVRDNGIGFKPEYSERIFGLFKRLHKDAYPGTGLGLAICKRIIERYGGRIWAEGQPDAGATFYFALPAAG